MASRETDSTLIAGHEYDGIQEFDNPTPAWWHTLWLGAIVFSIFYFWLSLGSPWFVHQKQRLAAAQQRAVAEKFGEYGELTDTVEDIYLLQQNPDLMAYAASIFAGNCTSCHAAEGRGNVGPNLRDDYYKNVKTITDIPNVIRNGANAGAMPAWGNRLHQNEIILMAAYVASLRGLEGGKAPEGEPIAPWPDPSTVQIPEVGNGDAGESS